MKNCITILLLLVAATQGISQNLLNPFRDTITNQTSVEDQALKVGYLDMLDLNGNRARIECSTSISASLKLALHVLSNKASKIKYYNAAKRETKEDYDLYTKLSLSLFLRHIQSDKGLLYVKQINGNNIAKAQLIEVWVQRVEDYTWRIIPQNPGEIDFTVQVTALRTESELFQISIIYYISFEDMEVMHIQHVDKPKAFVSPLSRGDVSSRRKTQRK